VPGFIGRQELLLLMLLILFGAKRLPEVGRSLGRGMREFKDGIVCREPKHEREPQGEADPGLD
jgi:sec-independent protein translocase protein TatA